MCAGCAALQESKCADVDSCCYRSSSACRNLIAGPYGLQQIRVLSFHIAKLFIRCDYVRDYLKDNLRDTCHLLASTSKLSFATNRLSGGMYHTNKWKYVAWQARSRPALIVGDTKAWCLYVSCKKLHQTDSCP